MRASTYSMGKTRTAFSVVYIVTVFLGCGFVAKYLEGGVRAAAMLLSLRRLGFHAGGSMGPPMIGHELLLLANKKY